MLPALQPIKERPVGDSLEARMHDIAEALTYPVDHRGRVYDVRFMLPALSYHLARAGGRIDPELAVVKKRRLPPAPGVVDDAVEWVPLDAEDSVDDELAEATLDDVARLSPAAKAELIRRLGGDPDIVEQDIDTSAGWHVATHIQFDQED